MQINCQNCGNSFDLDESSLDTMRIATCPKCSTSFQVPNAAQAPKGAKKGEEFEDFFEVGGEGQVKDVSAVSDEKTDVDLSGGGDILSGSAADFMQEAREQNPQPPDPTGEVTQKKDKPKEGKISDEVFGGLEGFEEFLSVGDEHGAKPAEPPQKPTTPSAPPPVAPKVVPPPAASGHKAPPKKEIKETHKPVTDAIDDAFEELFAEPPKSQTPPRPAPPVEAKPKQTEQKAVKKTVTPPSPPPKKDSAKAQAVDTVSDEAFEALFHDVKTDKGPKKKEGGGAPTDSILGVETPKRKRKISVKIILMVAVPILIVGTLSYLTVFTKKGLFGISFYSYFIEGYKKPSAAEAKAINGKFDGVQAKLNRDSYPDYLSSVKDMRDILIKDPRYVPGHAYLTFALLFSSSDPLNQNIKKEIEGLLGESDKLNPALNDGILARAYYNLRSGNYAEAEKGARRLLESGVKEPMAYEILGKIYSERGNYQEARKNLEESLKLQPGNLRVKYLLASVLYKDGKIDEALQAFDELRKEPNSHLVSQIDWYYIQYANFGKADEARAGWNGIFDKSADNLSDYDYSRLAGYISDILIKDGKKEEAAAIIEKGLKKDSFNHTLSYRLGLLNLEEGKPDKALPNLKRAVSLSPKNPGYYIALAQALRETKDPDQSIVEINKALEIEPLNITALIQKGISEKQTNKLNEAINTFAAILKQEPRNLTALIETGELYVKQDNLKEAKDYFSKAALADPKSARAHSGLGICYVGLGQTERALVEFEIAEKLSPNNPAITVNIGKSLLSMNKLADAQKNFERTVKLDPNNIEAYIGLGELHFQKQEYSDAVRVYKDALKISPKDVDLKVALAKAYVQLKQFRPALDELLDASKITVDYFPVHLQLGIVYRNLGNMDDSLRELEKSTVLRPDSPEAHFEYGVTLIQNTQVSVGLPQLFKAEELDPKYMPVLERLVEFYSETDDLPKAVIYSQKILKVDPNRWKARLRLAECYRKMGKDKEAYKTYLDVIRQNKYVAQAYLGAGEVLEEAKQFDKALSLYNVAARVDKNNPMVFYRLGFAYKYLNQKDKAIESFRRFLKVSPESPEAEGIKDEITYLMKR